MPSRRRNDIVHAASQIVAERGVKAMTVRAVAARAGIGASTLRHYFPTQRALYEAVVGAAFDRRLDDLRISDCTVPAAERLGECMNQFLPPDDDRVPVLERWLGLYVAAFGPMRTEQGAIRLAALTNRAHARIQRWLEVLEAEGVLDHNDRERHAIILVAAVDGLCLALIRPSTTTTVARARSVLAEIIATMVTNSSRR